MNYRRGGYTGGPFYQQFDQRQLLIGGLFIVLLALFLEASRVGIWLALAIVLGRVIGLVIGFSVHEWAHAYTALKLGDQTAYLQGRVSFNPLVHVDPIGTSMAILAGFGWAKPVPVNPTRFYPKERQGLLLVALAGPVSNLVIAIVVGLLLRFLLAVAPLETRNLLWFIYMIIQTIVIFNLVLMLFNLIPLSPLDGWKIMLGLLPPEQSIEVARYEQQSTMVLLLLLLIGIASPSLNLIWQLLNGPLNFLFRLIVGA